MCIICINADCANHLCTTEVCILVTDATTTEVATLLSANRFVTLEVLLKSLTKKRHLQRLQILLQTGFKLHSSPGASPVF